MDRHRRFARAEDKITQLSKQGLDMVSFWRACAPVLADVVPHYAAPCCYTIDPASGLVTSHFQEGLPELPTEWIAMEYTEDDVNQLTTVARSPSGVSTLHEATGGNPSSSLRWHANMAYGGDQEMIAGLRTRGGDVWGAIGLYRQPDRPLFDAHEKALLAAISPLMADAVRRALLIGDSADPEGPDAPVHTVQSHLRNVFTKTGVRARRDLVTKIFFAHYEPRLRDNEERTAANLPLRGGRIRTPGGSTCPKQAQSSS